MCSIIETVCDQCRMTIDSFKTPCNDRDCHRINISEREQTCMNCQRREEQEHREERERRNYEDEEARHRREDLERVVDIGNY